MRATASPTEEDAASPTEEDAAPPTADEAPEDEARRMEEERRRCTRSGSCRPSRAGRPAEDELRGGRRVLLPDPRSRRPRARRHAPRSRRRRSRRVLLRGRPSLLPPAEGLRSRNQLPDPSRRLLAVAGGHSRRVLPLAGMRLPLPKARNHLRSVSMIWCHRAAPFLCSQTWRSSAKGASSWPGEIILLLCRASGSVYVATDTRTGKQVVTKLMKYLLT
jgi:hypothetical protein